MGSARELQWARVDAGCPTVNVTTHRRVQPAFVDAGAGFMLHALPARCSTEATHGLPPCSICLLSRPRRLGSTSDYLIAALSPHIITRGRRRWGGEKSRLAAQLQHNSVKIFLSLFSALVLPLDSHCLCRTPLFLSVLPAVQFSFARPSSSCPGSGHKKALKSCRPRDRRLLPSLSCCQLTTATLVFPACRFPSSNRPRCIKLIPHPPFSPLFFSFVSALHRLDRVVPSFPSSPIHRCIASDCALAQSGLHQRCFGS